MIYASTGKVFVPQTMKMKHSLALRQMLYECPLHYALQEELHKIFLSSTLIAIREVNKSGARMTGQVILDKVFRTPFERLHCFKGEFDSLYDLINERGGDAIPLKNKVQRLIHQAHDLKDLQESYSNRMTTEVRDSCRVEVLTRLPIG